MSPEYSLEGLMLKLKLQYFGHLMRRTDSFEKTLMLGKDWNWEEKGMTENEMVGWHHWLNGYEFEQAPGVGDGQGSLACCSPWGHMTGLLNWTELPLSNTRSYHGTVCVCVWHVPPSIFFFSPSILKGKKVNWQLQIVWHHLQVCRRTWRHSFTWKSWMALPEGPWRMVSGGRLSFCVRNWRT